MEWYPQKKEELEILLNSLLKNNPQKKEVHGIIVPHAGYVYSGEIAGKAFSYLKNSKSKKVIILAPSHHVELRGLAKHDKPYLETPLGKIKVFEEKIRANEMNLAQEHAIGNQIPFLQKIGFQEVCPLMVGSITLQEAKKISEILFDEEKVFVISGDLSHFLDYNKATEKDKRTIEIIQDLNFEKMGQIDSCGIFPIAIAMNLCVTNKWKPKLIEYKNSGDITGDKSSVVGYASFCF